MNKNKKKRIRKELSRLQGGLCIWCKRPFTRKDPMSLEHLEAKSNCTNDHYDDMCNLAVAHCSCNSKRGHKPLREILMSVKPIKF